MKRKNEAANDFSNSIRENSLVGSNICKTQYQIGRKLGFLAGVEFAERWISVDEEMPEDNEYFLEPRVDELEAETTIKVLVMTELGDITDNRRIKMAVGKKEWVWFMGYDGDAQVIKWRPLNVL